MSLITHKEINDILNNTLTDPFDVLGMHVDKKNGVVVRAFVPEAKSLAIVARTAKAKPVAMELVHESGIYTCQFPKLQACFKYDLVATLHDGTTHRFADPYTFLPVMSEQDRFLFNEGNNQRIYDHLGSHLRKVEGINGVVFAVWAPAAWRVSVVGNFNGWDGRRHPMRRLGGSGVWELFIPGLEEGTIYKYEVKHSGTGHLVLKTDPYGYYQEPPTNHATIVCNIDKFKWNDEAWLARRAASDSIDQPMSIYELHLASWRKKGPELFGDWLGYKELAHELAEYVTALGFTHVELMPVQDHPYVPSWGYQVGGFYAANHRFGSPEDFQYFVNYLHLHNIGVILDWVPGHFPKDAYALAKFDGTCLYEHEDPREGEHKGWGTLIFNFGRHEVRNFQTSNALFWMEKFHIDGLRVDAVASMLYCDYERDPGEWLPNKYGGRENLESVEFLQSVNYLIHTKFPGAVTIAEESTAWPQVSRPTYLGGLGFSFKWNMGWMHDNLKYFSRDPIHRKHHHNQITFGLWYAFTENYVLVLSHDEVVHGKKSMLEKMPGDTWMKFANLRCLYGYMFGHPGKKLSFMGGEFGMHSEWWSLRSIDWHVLENEDDSFHHRGLMRLYSDLNMVYKRETALWEQDFVNAGFTWIDCTDSENSIVSFMRHGKEWHNFVVVACNFTPIPREGYRIGVPQGGFYKEILNTDGADYGGSNRGNQGGVNAEDVPCHNYAQSLCVTLPPLSTVMFKWMR